MAQDSGKLYYTIGEVAALLGENTSLVRFWSDNFPKLVSPKRTANKNNRLYMAKDIEALRRIHYLVKGCGLTLDGARRRMESGDGTLDRRVEAVSRLKDIRAQLKEIHDEM